MLLGLMSFATFLVPFSDTVYLPALSVIQHDLGTTPTLVSMVGVHWQAVAMGAALAERQPGGGGLLKGLVGYSGDVTSAASNPGAC